VGKENSRGIVSVSGLILSREGEAFNQTLEKKGSVVSLLNVQVEQVIMLLCCTQRNACRVEYVMSLRGPMHGHTYGLL
jgi:hypothetical protein